MSPLTLAIELLGDLRLQLRMISWPSTEPKNECAVPWESSPNLDGKLSGGGFLDTTSWAVTSVVSAGIFGFSASIKFHKFFPTG